MSFEFSFPIVLGNKTVNLKEISFNDYKNICKSFYSQKDAKNLSNLFNKILDTYVEGMPVLNVHEKVIILINIRSLTLGTEVKINYDHKNINLNTNYLISKLSYNQEPFDYVYDNIVLNFGLPNNFVIDQDDFINCICESLISITIDGMVLKVKDFDSKQKMEIINSLPSIPLLEVYGAIYNNCKDFNLTIPSIDNFKLNLFDTSFLYFLKFIFDEKMESVLDLEYNLRHHLNYNSYDLSSVTYPESKIMLNKFANEMKEKNKPEGGKTSKQA